MPVLDQHRDNPAFVQDLRRKRSFKHRIIAPRTDIPHKTSAEISPTNEVLPDAGISEVTSSLADLFSQGSPIPEDGESLDRSRQHRAPTADMTTALFQQRRFELTEGQAFANGPIPALLEKSRQDPHEDHDMSDADGGESSDEEIFCTPPVIGAAVSHQLDRYENEVRHDYEGNVSGDVEMTGADVSQSLFVSPNASQASTKSGGEVARPVQTVPTRSQAYSQDMWAEVAKLNERRDEEDPEFRPEVHNPILPAAPVVETIQEAGNQQPEQQKLPSPLRKRHSDEIRREAPKKPKAAQPNSEARKPTSIRYKPFLRCKDTTKQHRIDVISKCETYWGKSIGEVIPRNLWPRAGDKNTVLEPRDWPNTLLQQFVWLADLTYGNAEIASFAIMQGIEQRCHWYKGEGWIAFIDDLEVAVKLVESGQISVPTTNDGARKDSPLGVDERGPRPTRDSASAGASPGQNDRNGLGNNIEEEELYDSTPRPQRRPIVALPVSVAGPAELHRGLNAAAVADSLPRKTTAVEVVDLTMEDSTEDAKPHLAYDHGTSSPVPGDGQLASHGFASAVQGGSTNNGTRSPVQGGGSLGPPQGSDHEGLESIMAVSEDLSGFTIPSMFKVRRAARDLHFKAERELDASDGRKVEEIERMFKILNHTQDVQNWVEEEIKQRKMKGMA